MERAIITINKGWYYTAGRKFGWIPKYRVEGFGINVEHLQNYFTLEIIVENVSYELNCNNAIGFIKRFNSIEEHKGTKVGIISRSLLKEIIDPSKIVEESFPQPEILQLNLF